MYHGYATIAKGIRNTIRFNFLNGEQRPIDVHNKAFKFKMFEKATNRQVLEKDLTILDDNVTYTKKGRTELVIAGDDTQNLNSGIYTYSIVQVVDANTMAPVYVDGARTMSGNIELTDGVLPSFIASDDLRFLKITGYGVNPVVWGTGKVSANRDGKGNNALHTAQFYYTNFTGSIKIYGSLLNTIDGDNGNWVLLDTIYKTNQSTTDYYNLQGFDNFKFFKFEYSPDSGSIDKVLYRR